MYNLLTGLFPFDGMDMKSFTKELLTRESPKLREDFLSGQPNFDKEVPNVSKEARDLLYSLFDKNKDTRISARQALLHPWFSENTNPSKVDLTRSVCANIRAYAQQSGLRNVFINLMAQQLSISNSNVNRIAQIFDRIDKDKTGYLEPDELRLALSEAGFEPWDINLIIQQLDIRGEGE